MQASYTILEHPSDVGIEAHGKNLTSAFVQVARGMMSIIIDTSTVDTSIMKEIIITASDVEQLLVKWLSEILYLYDGQQFVAKEFEIQALTDTEMKAVVKGEMLSKKKHRTKMDIKAVTYHQLAVEENKRSALIRVFVDI
jgi:SHS2 domain-containing protein